jgi:hypothetical protein
MFNTLMDSFRNSLAYGWAAFLKPAVIGLLAWSALALAQRPPETDATTILERGRKAALDYSHSLPDFVCTEVIHRYAGSLGRSRLIDWTPTDTLTVQLGYFEQKEAHKLTLIDGKPTDRTYESLGGSLGVGEFGGMLHSIFDPSSAASFPLGEMEKRRPAPHRGLLLRGPATPFELPPYDPCVRRPPNGLSRLSRGIGYRPGNGRHAQFHLRSGEHPQGIAMGLRNHHRELRLYGRRGPELFVAGERGNSDAKPGEVDAESDGIPKLWQVFQRVVRYLRRRQLG